MLKEVMPKSIKTTSIFVILLKQLGIGMTCDYYASDYIIGWNQVIVYKYLKIF